MNKILAIFRKELLLKFSTKAEWLYFLILPILFAFIVSGSTGGPSDSRIRLLVTNQSDSPLATLFLAELSNSPAVNTESVGLDEAQRLMKQQSASAHLILPAEFDLEHALAGTARIELVELPNNLNALAASQSVTAVLDRINGAVAIAQTGANTAESIQSFSSSQARSIFIDQAFTQADTAINSAPDRLKVTEGATPDQVDYDPRANSSAGQLITWVFIPLFGLSAIFANERLSGTLKRLVVTPSSKALILFGIIFSNVVFAVVQMILLMLFGSLVMGVNWWRDPLAIGIMVVTSVLAAAAIGTALGTFVKTESQASGLSVMMGMVMALLGGCWYPLELFPAAVQKATMILPTRWAMQGMLDVIARGQGVAAVLPEAGILLAFAALFFVIGIMRFRYE